MLHFSRSFYDDFTECERKAYYGFLYRGSGLSPRKQNMALGFGIAVHESLATLLKSGGDIDLAIQSGVESWMKEGEKAQLTPEKWQEMNTLLKGLVYGWYRLKWNDFVIQYAYSMVEEECQLQIAENVTLHARPDALLTDRISGMKAVLNWKTTSSIYDWDAKWEYAIQTWTEALAIQETIGEPVNGCIYEGFFKGGQYKGMSTSPLVRGYVQYHVDGPPTYSAEKCKDHKIFRIDENFSLGPGGEGVRGWVDWLPEETLSEQFVRSSLIPKDDFMVGNWLKQVVRYLSDVEHMLTIDDEEDRLTFFKQKFKEQCKWCQFNLVCKGHTTLDSMVEDGVLLKREDHHGIGDVVTE